MAGKKTYIKPDISYIDFSMTSSTAGSCKFQANSAQDVCSPIVNSNGWMIYTAEWSCPVPIDNTVCYHVPTADTSLFSS